MGRSSKAGEEEAAGQRALSAERGRSHSEPSVTGGAAQELSAHIENVPIGVSSFGKEGYTSVDERKS